MKKKEYNDPSLEYVGIICTYEHICVKFKDSYVIFSAHTDISTDEDLDLYDQRALGIISQDEFDTANQKRIEQDRVTNENYARQQYEKLKERFGDK